MRVRFDSFTPDVYSLFLKVKRLPESNVVCDQGSLTYVVDAPARFAKLLGVATPPDIGDPLPILPSLLDDQRAVLGEALAEKRYAVYCDCGWGKTLLGLEWGRHVVHRTGGRVLIVTLNEVVTQWVGEAAKFYGDSLAVRQLGSRAEMRAWMKAGEPGLAITNYEKWNPESLDHIAVGETKFLAGLICDEASRLKSGSGRQKVSLVESSRGVEYKLALTATPAPNEWLEFNSQAVFLERAKKNELYGIYFRRDETTHRWTLRPHAREAFFRFLAGWSVFIRDPKRYGWRLSLPDVPEPTTTIHELPITPQQREAWLRESVDPDGQRHLFHTRETNAIQRMKLSQIAKGFRYRKDECGEFDRFASAKPARVAELVRAEVAAGRPTLVWTVFDAEGEILSEELDKLGVRHESLTGSTPKGERLKVLDRFRSGGSPALLTRPQVLGWGMNLQFVKAMVFSGFSDSFEQHYQAVRRSYRFGQTDSLRVHVPLVRELEGEMWDNLCRKESQNDAAIAEMESYYLAARGALCV